MSAAETNSNDEEYFESYADLEVHKLMLADSVRNEAYRSAICDNPDIFNGKTVLDVGTGTGFLAILCAKAGASKVYAVEASDMAELATINVHENEVVDKVQVVQSRVEDVELPEKVDIIVSEWMGFYLLHESMLDSVIFARDKFLKPEGFMYPYKCILYSAPSYSPELFKFWENISGMFILFIEGVLIPILSR
uniref:Probable protein arginine N-methyltransferase 6.2 n=2 Tax=Cacopsylla melanoneura TaxID=428564 RepID=A0A8D8XX88_9HEMI